MKKKLGWIMIAITLLCFVILSKDVIASEVNSTDKIYDFWVEKSLLKAPDKQNMVLFLGNGNENITDVILVYQNSNGTEFHLGYDKKEENQYFFSLDFEKEDADTYHCIEIKYVKDNIHYSVVLAEYGLDIKFSVSEGTDTQSANFSAYRAFNSNSYAATKKDYIVVAIDSGHGGKDGGAVNSSYGVCEKNLVFKIAQYLKAELEEYSGVKVYMTRTTDEYVALDERINRASAAGADVVVSLHLNALNKSTRGAEVYYPNQSLDAAIGNKGKNLASSIQSEIVKLGLSDRGIKVRNSQKERYSDGSVGDYYSIIKYSKLAGFPGIIVEHAYIDNNSEYLTFLNTEDKLRKLGVADATGIAKALGLKKEPSITVENIDEFAGTAKIITQGLGKNAKVKISNGENIQVVDVPTGRKDIDFNIASFNNARGIYTIEVFNPNNVIIYSTDFYISQDTSCNVTSEEIKFEEEYKLSAQFADMPSTVEKLQFSVWSEVNDKDDLKKYTAEHDGNGLWTAMAKISNHKSAGKYHVSAQAVLESGIVKEIGQTEFEISEPTLEITVGNYNKEQGTVEVILSNVQSATGVEKIEVCAWSARDQRNTAWYTAKEQGDDTYKVTVDQAKHMYMKGQYTINAYITAKNGIKAFAGEAIQLMEVPTGVEIALPFRDCSKSDWFYDYVKNVFLNEIITGMTTTTFEPQGMLTRAQFAVILHRMEGEPETAYTSIYSDVPKGTWYTSAVMWANEQKIINGYGNGKFGSNDRITREQMAVMMLRYGEYKGYDMTERISFNSFGDARAVNAYAYEAMQWAVAAGIINGREQGNRVLLVPQGNATRAECAAIITRFMEKYVD